MIGANNFEAFQTAFLKNNLYIIKILFDHASSEQKKEMIKIYENNIFLDEKGKEKFSKSRYGLYSKKEYEPLPRAEIMKYLMSESLIFFDFEEKNTEHLKSYINQELASLRKRSNEFKEYHPTGVFDLKNDEQAKHYCYILRNLIRRNDDKVLADIFFLSEIPAIKKFVHIIIPEQESELSRLLTNTVTIHKIK